ncbi:hypothetical protein ACKJSM_24585 [Pseudomonas sp. PHC1]|uniref:hypothetical protein n=1 Tax=Pseudomonas sp. PHC1 TaxID=3384759 RepID=UPI00396F28AD
MLDFLYRKMNVDFIVWSGTVRKIQKLTDDDGYVETVVRIENDNGEIEEVDVSGLEFDLKRNHRVSVFNATTAAIDYSVFALLRNDCLSQSALLVDGEFLFKELGIKLPKLTIFLISLVYGAIATWIAGEGGLISAIVLFGALHMDGRRRRKLFAARIEAHLHKLDKQYQSHRMVKRALARS